MSREKSSLTETQRQYLKGEYSHDTQGAERKMRSDIRNRVGTAIHDLEIIYNYMDRRDIDQLFEEPEPVSHSEAARDPDSVAQKTLEEQHERSAAYQRLVALIALVYEIHWFNNWDFSNALRLALERAHGEPRMMGENPRELPRRVVNEDEFIFNPALESAEDYSERLTRLQQKADEQEEPLTDEERLFLLENHPWESPKAMREFVKEQRKLRSAYRGADEFVAQRPWLGDDSEE